MHTQHGPAARTAGCVSRLLLLPLAATACFEDRLPDRPRTLSAPDAGSDGVTGSQPGGPTSSMDASSSASAGGAAGMPNPPGAAGIGGQPFDASVGGQSDANKPGPEAGKPGQNDGDPLGQVGEACEPTDPCGPNLSCVDGTCCTSDCIGLCSTCTTDGESCVAPASDEACDIQCPSSTICATYPDNPKPSCLGLGSCAPQDTVCAPTFASRGEPCGVGRECDGFGSCDSVCAAEQTFCDDRCFDLQSSETHCGDCSTPCYFNSACSSGACSALTRLQLSELEDDGPFGFTVDGDPTTTNCSGSVSILGDINGDGRADLGIGSFGRGYVVYGSATTKSVRLQTLFNRGFAISDSRGPGLLFGARVIGAGDVNGDTIPDFMVAQSSASPGGLSRAGEVYVIFGKRDFADIDMASFEEGGFTVEGRKEDQFLETGQAAGDVNGDGLSDLAFGAQGEDRVFVVLGKSSTSPVPLNNMGPAGFTIQGPPGGPLGYNVNGAGDVNGDGLDDLVVGITSSSLVAIVFGAQPSSDVDLNALGSRGFLIRADEALGERVAGAGDVNGDDLDDLIVSADNNAWVVFGKKDSGEISLNTLAEGGFEITGNALLALAQAGDVNGDGLGDLLVGDFIAEPEGETGTAYVVFGKPGNGSVDITDLSGAGIAFDGLPAGDLRDSSVIGGGDINGDGRDDILLGTSCPVGNKSGAYAVFSLSEHD